MKTEYTFIRKESVKKSYSSGELHESLNNDGQELKPACKRRKASGVWP
jgi:hypothetical protein